MNMEFGGDIVINKGLIEFKIQFSLEDECFCHSSFGDGLQAAIVSLGDGFLYVWEI
jgi:hypothetical protein